MISNDEHIHSIQSAVASYNEPEASLDLYQLCMKIIRYAHQGRSNDNDIAYWSALQLDTKGGFLAQNLGGEASCSL